MAPARLTLAISACLTGQAVRYDGDHQLDEDLLARLAPWTELIPLCPEMAIGLGVPRPPIQLVNTTQGVRVLGVADAQQDVTQDLTEYGREVAQNYPDVDGIILKSRSPSCGLHSVKVHDAEGRYARSGRGGFAAALQQYSPDLPLQEEASLKQADVRRAFLERALLRRPRQLNGALCDQLRELLSGRGIEADPSQLDWSQLHSYLQQPYTLAGHRKILMGYAESLKDVHSLSLLKQTHFQAATIKALLLPRLNARQQQRLYWQDIFWV